MQLLLGETYKIIYIPRHRPTTVRNQQFSREVSGSSYSNSERENVCVRLRSTEMRPGHQHRVLKESLSHQENGSNYHNHRPLLNPQHLIPLAQNINLGGHVSNALVPHSHAPQNPYSRLNVPGKLNPQHGNQLPRLDAASDREQLINLQQRIKELEKENFKLQHHVQQAEQSIRNYREILLAHNITNFTMPSGKENKIETKSLPTIPTELPSVKPSTIDVDAIRSQHQQEIKSLREMLEKANRDHARALQSLTSEKDNQVNLVADLQRKISQLQDSFAKERASFDSKLKERELKLEIGNSQAAKTIAELNERILRMEAYFSQEKDNYEKRIKEQEHRLSVELGEHEQLHQLQKQLQDQLQHALATRQVKVKTPSPKKKQQRMLVEDLAPYFHDLSDSCAKLKCQFDRQRSSCKEEVSSMQHFCYQSVQLVVRRCKEMLQHKELEMERLKVDHDTTIISYMEQIEDLSGQLIKSQEIRVQNTQNRSDLGCSPIKHLSESPSKQLRLREKEESKSEINRLRKQIMDANLAVHGLQDVHGAEIKAVKHVAHIKELLRVAKEREQSLDRDRLQIELKHLK